MLNLFTGEVYRLLHKRNLYFYLGAVALGYVALTIVRSRGFAADSVVNDAVTFFGILPPLLGGYFFTSVYTDDLSAKALNTLVGYGMSRTRIVLTKFGLMALFTAASFGIIAALHLATYGALGFAAVGIQLRGVLVIAVQYWLLTLGFAAVAAMVVYGLQRSTFAVVGYFMLAFSVVTMLVNAVSTLLHVDLSDHLLTGTTIRIMGALLEPGGLSSLIAPGLEFLLYLVLATITAIFAFKNREMEF